MSHLNTKPEAILAAFATFKTLFSKGQYKSPYQILAEFINYIIYSENLHNFSATNMKNRLKNVFGFDVPEAVIKASIKSLKDIELRNHVYYTNLQSIKMNKEFNSFIDEAEKDSFYIIQRLISFIREQSKEEIEINETVIFKEFIAYLLDEYSIGTYSQFISKFILCNESDSKIQKQLNDIREGSVLYIGLSQDIRETGSIRKQLTLYLDMEILFDIVGYNGEIYLALAKDFIDLVKEANSNSSTPKIIIRYFDIIKKEIESFFYSAEQIVIHNKNNYDLSPAMRHIVNGCEDSTDVVSKRADFFYRIRYQFGILEDERANYYTEEDNSSNLEGINLNDYIIDEKYYDSLRLVSHINKLRKNKSFYNYVDSEYLLVTDTSQVIEISRSLTNELNKTKNNDTERALCGYAVNLNFITNLLWYKLNKGFSKQPFPLNLTSVIKAKIVLSHFISGNIVKTYKDLRNQYKAGEITEEQLVSRILALKQKSENPENINAENVDDSMDFSPEYISRFEDRLKKSDEKSAEYDSIIEQLHLEAEENHKHHNEEIKNLQNKIDKLEIDSTNKEQQIIHLCNLVKYFENKEQKKKQVRETWKARVCFIFNVICKLLAFVIGILGLNEVCDYFQVDFAAWLSISLSVLGLLPIGINIGKTDYKKYRERTENILTQGEENADK